MRITIKDPFIIAITLRGHVLRDDGKPKLQFFGMAPGLGGFECIGFGEMASGPIRKGLAVMAILMRQLRNVKLIFLSF